uniref:Mucin-12-like n=1 Tax=Diabrotica virgifera virgifera TaxID=50390 RepID=A0A6P7F2A4_DIAVI
MKTGVIVVFVILCSCNADLTDQSVDHTEGVPGPTVITHINTTNLDGHLLLSTINILEPKADSSVNNTISSQTSVAAQPNDSINRPIKGPIDKELNKGNNTFNPSTNDIKINILNSGLKTQETAGNRGSEKAVVEKNKSEVPKASVISENNAKLGHDLKLVPAIESISSRTNEIGLENASRTKFSIATSREPTTLVTTNIGTDSTIPPSTTHFTTPDNTYVTPSTYTERETTYSPYGTHEPTTIIPHSIKLDDRFGSNTSSHDAVTTSTHHHRNGTHKSSTHRYHRPTAVSGVSTGHTYHKFNKYTMHHYGTRVTHATPSSTSNGHHRFRPTHRRTHVYNRFSDTTETADTSPNSTNIYNNNATTVTSTTSRYHRYKPVHKNQHSYHRYSKTTTTAPETHTTHRYQRYKPVRTNHYIHRHYSHFKPKSVAHNETKTNSTDTEDNNIETTTISTHRYHRYKPIHKTAHNYHSSYHRRTTQTILNGSTTEASNNGDNNTETTTMSVISSTTHRYHRFHPKTNIYNRYNIQRSHNRPSGSYFYTTRHHSHKEQGNNGNYSTTEMSINKNIYQNYRYRNHFSNRFLNHPSSTENSNSTSSNTTTPNATKTEEPNINPEADSGTDATTTEISSTNMYDMYKRMRHRMNSMPHSPISKHIQPTESDTSESIGNETTIRPTSSTSIYQRYRNVHRPMQMKRFMQINHKEAMVTADKDENSEHTTQPGITAETTSVYDRYRKFHQRINIRPHVETSNGTTQTHSNSYEPSQTDSIANEITTQEPTASTSVYERFRHAYRPLRMRPLVQAKHEETTTLDITDTPSNSFEPNPHNRFGNEISTQEPTASTSVYDRYRHAHIPMHMRPLVPARYDETTTLDITDTTQTPFNSFETNPTDRFGNEIFTQEPTASTSVYERYRHAHRPMRMRPLAQTRHEETTTLDTTDTTDTPSNLFEPNPTDRFGNEITSEEPTASTSVYERFRHAYRPMHMRPLVQARYEETTTLDTADTTQPPSNSFEPNPTDRFGNEITSEEPTASTSVYERFRHTYRPVHMRPLMQTRHKETPISDSTDSTDSTTDVTITTDTTDVTSIYDRYRRFRNVHKPVHMRPIITTGVPNTSETKMYTYDLQYDEGSTATDATTNIPETNRPRIHMRPRISEVNHREISSHSQHPTRMLYNRHLYDRRPLSQHKTIVTDNINTDTETSLAPELSGNEDTDSEDFTLSPVATNRFNNVRNRRRYPNQRSFFGNEDDDSVTSVPTLEFIEDHETHYHRPIRIRPRHLATHRRPFYAEDNYEESDLDPEESEYKVRRRPHNRHLRRKPHYYTESEPTEYYGAYGKNIPEERYRNNDGNNIALKFQNQRSQNLATKTDTYEEDPESYNHEGRVKVKHSISDNKYFNSLERGGSVRTNPVRADVSASESIINRKDRDTLGIKTSDIILNDEENSISNTEIRQNGSLNENNSENKRNDSVSVALEDTLFADEASDDSLFNTGDHAGSDLFGDAVDPTILPSETVTVSLPKSFYSSSLDDVSEEANNQTSLKKTNNTINQVPNNSENDEELIKERNISGLSETELHQMQRYIDERKSMTEDETAEETTEQELVTVDPKHWYTLAPQQDTSDSNEVDREINPKSDKPIIIEELFPNTRNETQSFTTETIITESTIETVTVPEITVTTEAATTENKVMYFTMPYEDNSNSSGSNTKSKTTENGYSIEELGMENIAIKSRIDVSTESSVIPTTDNVELSTDGSFFFTDNKAEQMDLLSQKNKTAKQENITIAELNTTNIEPVNSSNKSLENDSNFGKSLKEMTAQLITELKIFEDKNKTEKSKNETIVTDIAKTTSNHDNNKIELTSNSTIKYFTEEPTTNRIETVTSLEMMDTEHKVNKSDILVKQKQNDSSSNSSIENKKNETVTILDRIGSAHKVNESDSLVKQKQNDPWSNSSMENKKVETVRILEEMDTEHKINKSVILANQKQNDSSSNSSIENQKDSTLINSLTETSTEANFDAETTTESERNSTTFSLTESSILVLPTTNQTVVQESDPVIVTNIFGRKSNFTAQLQMQNSSDYLPSDVNVTEDAINQVLNFTWSPHEDVVNTISLNLRKVSKHYVIGGLQLYLVKDGNVSVWTKNEIQPQKDKVSKQLCFEIENGIQVTFSNLDFLTAEEETDILADKHQVEAAEKSDTKSMSVEIIGGVGVLLCAVLVAMIVSYRIIKMKKRGKATLNSRV